MRSESSALLIDVEASIRANPLPNFVEFYGNLYVAIFETEAGKLKKHVENVGRHLVPRFGLSRITCLTHFTLEKWLGSKITKGGARAEFNPCERRREIYLYSFLSRRGAGERISDGQFLHGRTDRLSKSASHIVAALAEAMQHRAPDENLRTIAEVVVTDEEGLAILDLYRKIRSRVARQAILDAAVQIVQSELA